MQRVALLLILLVPVFAQSQQSAAKAPWDSLKFFVGQRVGPQQQFVDSDRDGLNDDLEQPLLEKFAPTFLIGRQECSSIPAEFARDVSVPNVKEENGTIYGQAFPAITPTSGERTVELHFYHLWKQDCGAQSHSLDAEHVSALVRASTLDRNKVQWKVLYLVCCGP
jgi:hypothetical protein